MISTKLLVILVVAVLSLTGIVSGLIIGLSGKPPPIVTPTNLKGPDSKFNVTASSSYPTYSDGNYSPYCAFQDNTFWWLSASFLYSSEGLYVGQSSIKIEDQVYKGEYLSVVLDKVYTVSKLEVKNTAESKSNFTAWRLFASQDDVIWKLIQSTEGQQLKPTAARYLKLQFFKNKGHDRVSVQQVIFS